MTFGDMFSDLCAANGKAPTAVAIELGFSNSTATIWKRGARPRPSAIKKIADYFGVSVDYFSEKKEKPVAQSDGQELREFISLISRLSPQNLAVLTAAARAMLEVQSAQDSPLQDSPNK